MTGPVDRLRTEAEEEGAAYRQGADRPLVGYGWVEAAYAGVVLGLGLLARRRGRLPDRVGLGDVVLIGVATHRMARTMAKDPVLSPLRAPFTRYVGLSGPSELQEEPRGEGVRHAMGELVTCPFCVGHWVATGFTAGLVVAPRATRVIAAGLSALALGDALQFAYAALERTER